MIWLTTPGTFEIFLFYTFLVWDIAHVTLLTENCKISYSLGVYLVCLKIGAFLNFLTLMFSACLCQSHNFLPQFWYEIRIALIKTFQMVYHIWLLGFYLRVWKKRHKNSGVKGLISMLTIISKINTAEVCEIRYIISKNIVRVQQPSHEESEKPGHPWFAIDNLVPE